MTKRSMLGSLMAVCLVLVLIPALSSEVAGAPAALDAGRLTGTTTTPPFSAAAQTPTSTETPGASPELGCSTLTSPDQIPSPERP
jgi:hypothetical protein